MYKGDLRQKKKRQKKSLLHFSTPPCLKEKILADEKLKANEARVFKESL